MYDQPSTQSSSFQQALSVRYLVFSIGLSIACIAGISWYTYTPGLLASLTPKRLPGLFIAFVISVLRSLFATLRLRVLSDERLTMAGAVRVSLAWDFSSGIMPSWIGGAPLAAVAMTREKLNAGESAALMVFATFLDQLFFVFTIPLLLLASIFWKVFPPGLGHAWTLATILAFVVILGYASLLAFGVLVNASIIRRFLNRVTDFGPFRSKKETVLGVAEQLQQSAESLKVRPRRFLWRSFMFTSLVWVCRMALPIAVLLSFMPADPWLSFLRSMAVNFGGLLMPTPGGAGGMEGLFAVFLGPLMIRPGFMGLVIFLWRLIGYYLSIGAGLVVVFWYMRAGVASGNAASN